MITVETPLRAIHSQREAIEQFLKRYPDSEEFVRGALAVLDWLEHGDPQPVEVA